MSFDYEVIYDFGDLIPILLLEVGVIIDEYLIEDVGDFTLSTSACRSLVDTWVVLCSLFLFILRIVSFPKLKSFCLFEYMAEVLLKFIESACRSYSKESERGSSIAFRDLSIE